MKRFISVLLSIVLSAIPVVTASADMVDPSEVVVSYTEYEEITDVDTLLAMTEIAKQGVMQLSLTEENNRIKFSENDNQVIVDQLLSETVYADGSVVEQRTNAAIEYLSLNYPYDQHSGGNSTIGVVSRIYYNYYLGNSLPFYIIAGSTTIVSMTGSQTATISQELALLTQSGGTYVDYFGTATHTNVTLGTEKYKYPDHHIYCNLDPQYFQFESTVELSNGASVFLIHTYAGENEYYY